MTRILIVLVSFSSILSALNAAEPTRLALSVSLEAFSPNDDGISDSVTITVDAGDQFREVKDWILRIEGEGGKPVRTMRADQRLIRPPRSPGNLFLPSRNSVKPIRLIEERAWDGRDDAQKTVADGNYRITLSVGDLSGKWFSSAPVQVEVNSKKPELQALLRTRAIIRTIGPDGKPSETLSGEVLIAQGSTLEAGASFTGQILSASGEVIETNQWKSKLPQKVTWNGKNSAGKAADFGSYVYRLSVRTKSGVVVSTDLPGLVISETVPGFDLQTDDAFSPNGDGKKDQAQFILNFPNQTIRYTLKSWKMQVYAADKLDRPIMETAAAVQLPGVITWDGKDSSGKIVVDGIYTIRFLIEHQTGTASSGFRSLRIDTRPPVLSVSLSAGKFTPDGTGEDPDLRINPQMSDESGIEYWSLRALCAPDTGPVIRKQIKSWQGIAEPESIQWNGTGDNSETLESLEPILFVLQARDRAGNFSAPVTVDMVTGIIFRELAPGSTTVYARIPIQKYFTKDNKLNSSGKKALSSIMQSLNRYGNYKATFYLNSALPGKEEVNLEISERRAFSVNEIVMKDWPADRLKYQGLGESEALSLASDDFSQYRNERIEVLLEIPPPGESQ